MIRALLILFSLVSLQAWALSDAIRSETMTKDGLAYQIADLDLKQADLKLYWKNAEGNAYGTLAAIREAMRAEGKVFLMATNAGIYARDFTPLGLHVERGLGIHALNRSRASTGNFFMIPNGVFIITAQGPRILETTEYAKLKTTPLEGTQSGPLLVRRGKVHPRFKEESENKKIRSGVGINGEGHVIFALSGQRVGFYEFALFFRDTLHCQNALYLDGTISTLMTSVKNLDMQLVPFVGIWAASRSAN